MKDWIRDLKEWIEAHPESKFHDEPSYFDLNRQESWQYPTDKSEENGIISHTRSGSVESSFSFSSIPESISELAAARVADSEPQRPPPLQLSSLRPYSDDSSPTKSDGSCTASPTELELFDGPTASTNGSYDGPIQHNRNASYAGQEQHSHRTEISAKMSMPDLRSAKIDFTKRLPARSQTVLPSLDGGYSLGGDSTQGQSSRSPDLSLSINTEMRSSASFTEESSTPRATYSMAFERNSYFRRLSTFPASVTLPQSLLCLVETARSLLFAACQVYQTLDHYIVHVDERLSSVLRKVLEPASSDMLQLIAALDRFDASSRKALPPPAICRAVVESCRNTAAAFNKVVRVLTLQLQVLTACDDVRYSRLLLVELYTATAEIACAWKKMLPQIRHVKSLLHMNWSASHHIKTSETKSVAPLDLSALAFRHFAGSGLNSTSGKVYRARTVRRHAGSFSSKDVEIGKQLPSYDNPSYQSSGSQGHPQTQRNPRRQATTPVTFSSTQNSPHLPLSPAFVNRSSSRGTELDRGHSRHGSQSSIHASSLSSSPIISGKLTTSFELLSNSRIQVDKEALHAIKEAVDVAPTVWNMIEDMLEDILSSKADFREGLNKARAVTKRLANVVVTMQESDSPTDRKLLREDARSFLKAVVQLSNAVKTYKEAHDVPSVLRNSMVRLTNATEEFAILLHVSSFSPTTPRSFSPVISPPLPPTHTAQQNDSQLGSSLSRSRTAQVSSNVTPDYPEGPRSALPAQPFMIPTARRTGRKESP
ncbi:hypothetical protein AX14_002529 [Amanita brunnescens Koide BX004]|nr:hypothetical protein AX14_002529 [Amanita brunnescens Koide BX004]